MRRVLLCLALLVTASFRSAAASWQEPPRPSFPDWLNGVRAEALSRGIRQEVLDEALGGIDEPLPVVLERDRSQAELVLPLEQYIARRVAPAGVKTARGPFAGNPDRLNEG